jgi:hypothetical protein
MVEVDHNKAIEVATTAIYEKINDPMVAAILNPTGIPGFVQVVMNRLVCLKEDTLLL